METQGTKNPIAANKDSQGPAETAPNPSPSQPRMLEMTENYPRLNLTLCWHTGSVFGLEEIWIWHDSTPPLLHSVPVCVFGSSVDKLESKEQFCWQIPLLAHFRDLPRQGISVGKQKLLLIPESLQPAHLWVKTALLSLFAGDLAWSFKKRNRS